MKLSELLRPELVICPLKARDKESALSELSVRIAQSANGVNQDQIVGNLQARERQGPFSMGKSVAFPHARIDTLRELQIGIGTSPEGIDFGAPDGNPIHVVILFLLPRRHSNLYLQTLATFLNYFTNERNLERASRSRSASEFLDLIRGFESSGAGQSPVEELIQPTPFLRINQSVAHAIETVLANRVERIPVVNAQGQLEGEVTLSSLLRYSTPEHKAKPLRELADSLIDAPRVVVSDSTALPDLADRLSRENAPVAYVVRDRRLIGQINPVELLRRMIAR